MDTDNPTESGSAFHEHDAVADRAEELSRKAASSPTALPPDYHTLTKGYRKLLSQAKGLARTCEALREQVIGHEVGESQDECPRVSAHSTAP